MPNYSGQNSNDWWIVRERIQEIGSRMDLIEGELDQAAASQDRETIARLHRLQEKFEKVMRSLAAFDDSSIEQFEANVRNEVRMAKEELRSVLKRYRITEEITEELDPS